MLTKMKHNVHIEAWLVLSRRVIFWILYAICFSIQLNSVCLSFFHFSFLPPTFLSHYLLTNSFYYYHILIYDHFDTYTPTHLLPHKHTGIFFLILYSHWALFPMTCNCFIPKAFPKYSSYLMAFSTCFD